MNTGTITLGLRMAAYAASSMFASTGFLVVDPETLTVTIDLVNAANAFGGIAAFLGTFATSRFAKTR